VGLDFSIFFWDDYKLYTNTLAAATLTTRNTGQTRLERRAMVANPEVFREAQEL
jgi:hypothetical protein